MIRKTVKWYVRLRPKPRPAVEGGDEAHEIDQIVKTTWWFLFIPIYSSERFL